MAGSFSLATPHALFPPPFTGEVDASALARAVGGARHKLLFRFRTRWKRPSAKTGFQSEAGYTLVELLVVVAILGLLTLIATPFVLRYLDSAKVSTARTEIANISAGLDLFKIDIGRYPTTEEGLDALMKAPAGVDNWNGPYIKKATGLKDPWGRPYLYRSPGEHGEFDIYSYGAKGEASASGE